MTDRKADYGEISEVYDEVRSSDLPHIVWWQAKLIAEGRLGPGKRLLDLGCGTGRWTIPLAKRTGCTVVGIDNCPQMLQKAREKDPEGRVQWVEGDVERLRFEPDSFDCALMVLMMHHLKDHLATFRAVRRVLRPGGVFLIRQGTLEDILEDPFHRFFPEIVTIDRKRTPFRCEIEWWLAEAGFDRVRAETFRQHTYATNMRLLEEVQKRVCSALRMIDEDAYNAGMARLTEHLRRHTDDASVRDSLFTLFVGRKPDGD
jgi:ubiquinone/menaquinone biosynthesis C-methylase UbiE